MENYKFPDEVDEVKDEGKSVEEEVESKGKPVEEEDKIEIEIEDDTPVEDRGRRTSKPEFVEKVEKDELDLYSQEARSKIDAFRKFYHDERREKEKALREQQEAVQVAKSLYEEIKQLKGRVNSSDEAAISSFKTSAERELDMAKKEYREAYDAGDSEKLVEAQDKLTTAKMKIEKASNYAENINQRKALQEQENEVKIPQQTEATPVRDQKASAWQERNSWFGQDDEMTSLALGLHEKLVKENGLAYATTNEYYKRIDETMRRRFPENFEGEKVDDEKSTPRLKPSTVVAPASRSTSSKKIKLNTSQLAIAKKLGLTPEQYARELIKMEA
jgi:hypothetical protein